MKKISIFISFFCLSVIAATAGTKTNYRNALIFAYSNCVYEDDNIKLEIYNEQLWATNKTKKTLFIDLAQCFAIHNGSATPLTSNTDKKQGNKKASQTGFTTKEGQYITIAPDLGSKQQATFICNIATKMYGNYSTTESPSGDFTDYDKKMLNVLEELLEEAKSEDGKTYTGTATRHFTEDESINNIGASIAYASTQTSENWTTVTMTSWVSDVTFAPYYVTIPKDLKKKEKAGFGIKETAPAVVHIHANSPFEFDAEKSPLIVMDWEGNYKKGTFKLTYTWIPKVQKMNAFAAISLALFSPIAFGALAATTNIIDNYYKKVVSFDNSDSDWGSMKYVKNILLTNQKE